MASSQAVLITSPAIAQLDYTLQRFCERCSNKLIPVFGTFKRYCPNCNRSLKNVYDLNPSFENTLKLINGGFTDQLLRSRFSSLKFERDQLIKDIRDRIIQEIHSAGILTYQELEVFFGLRTRRLYELCNKEYFGLLSKNCTICKKVMEFGNNYYLFKTRKFCSPKCKSIARRKYFRYLKKTEQNY
jgi:hypothetical protein